MSSFLFWFIFCHLCIDHYGASSVIFFSPLNVCFLLSIVCVHSLAACVNQNDFSASCYTWLGFLISSTHHSKWIFINSWLVADDNSFVLGLFCYHSLSFHNHESYLYRVFMFFCRLFAFVFVSLGCVYLCSHLFCTFDGWVPIFDFYFQGFIFIFFPLTIPRA